MLPRPFLTFTFTFLVDVSSAGLRDKMVKPGRGISASLRVSGRTTGLQAFFLAIMCLLPLVGVVQAQSLFSGGFERDVNRYRWTGELQLEQTVREWRLDVSNRFRSDAFILFNDRLSFRDENHTDIVLRRSFADGALSMYSRTGWYSLSRVFNQEIIGGFRFPLSGQVWLEPILGAQIDRRPGFAEGADTAPLRTDAGPSAGLRVSIPSTFVDEYAVQGFAEARFQSIAPRRGDYFRAEARAERTFEQTRLGTQFQAASVRRDAYQAASFLNRDDSAQRVAETIESTRSDTVAATLFIDVPVAASTGLAGRLDVSANRRRVETLQAPESALFFDSEFSRRVVDAELSSTYARNQALIRFSIRAGAEVERRRLANEEALPPAQATQKLNLLRQADYDRGYFQAHVNARIPVGPAVILADVSANILHHDTPDLNPDDRDELYYNGLFGLTSRLVRTIDLQIQIFGTYYHTVYLKSQRSAENNVQRSLRFRPSVTWRPGDETRVVLTTEVRATYTVDDFLLPGRRPSDQSARELSYDLEGEQDLGNGIRLRVSGRLSDLRLGRFLDGVFAEIPYDTLRTTSAWVRLAVGERVQAEVGIRTFIRTDYDRSTSVRYYREDVADQALSITRPGRRKIAQFGPTASVLWPLSGGTFLRLDGWATVQRVTNRLYGALPEGLEETIRKAAKKGTHTLIPNLAVTMQWRF